MPRIDRLMSSAALCKALLLLICALSCAATGACVAEDGADSDPYDRLSVSRSPGPGPVAQRGASCTNIGDCDPGECCSAYAKVCVVGRMTGGCVGGSPGCEYPGQPNHGVCLADTDVPPLPAAQCEIRQPADEVDLGACSSDGDCAVGCCATSVGRCVKGTTRDYYGYPAVCAVRTDFAVPAELCEGP